MEHFFEKIGLRHYPLTWLVVVAIHVLCLFPVPETPLNGIAFIDKWTHLVMFGGLSLTFIYEYMCHHGMQGFWGHGKLQRIDLKALRRESFNMHHLRLGALWFPIFLGGWMEVLQATCTGGTRSGDIIDWVADTLGVVIVWIILLLFLRTLRK